MNRPRGRPPRHQTTASREEMMLASLDLLDSKGVEAFTMRSVAERLEVNPMTIYHHFGDRDGLIGAISEHVYRSVSAPNSGAPHLRIETLLRSYHSQVLKHPGLALLIFSSPTAFPDQARRITEDIVRLLTEAGISPAKLDLWVSILVDFTHGAAIATAMSRRTVTQGSDCSAGADDGYSDTLKELLDRLPSRP